MSELAASVPACTRCHFVTSAVDPNTLQRTYICKRMPPAPFAVQVRQQVQVQFMQPVVNEASWCFMFQPALTPPEGANRV